MDENDFASMTSQRPYLVRALWEWINDNGMTPHLLVDAHYPGVRVPPHTVNEGKVVLNIADRAVAHLQMGNEDVAFSARFGGVTHAVIVPIGAVLAIYARETGQGMAFPPEQVEDDQGHGIESGLDPASCDESTPSASSPAASAAPPVFSVVGEARDGDAPAGDDDPGPPTPPPAGGRPRLRVVK